MRRDSAYFLEASAKTRNIGLVMSLVLVPGVLGFMYIDSVTPALHDIVWWRIGAMVPALLFLSYALFLFPRHQRLAIPLHVVQLTGLIVTMCGITADLATRPDFPEFARTALISSLLVCIFADFAFAGGARRYLWAILITPLAVMSAYILVAGEFLTQMQRLWLISNPAAMAVGLSILALYQERSSIREFKVRSDLRHAEEALRGSEKKYHELFDKAEVGMFQMRLDGSQIIDVNRKFLEITGRTRQDMIGTLSVTHWADPREHMEIMRVLARDGRVTNMECRIVDASGSTRTCLTSLSQHSDQNIIEGSLLDITERKRLEAERLDLERRIAAAQRLEGLGILAGGVAHNFNNLLMVMLGHAELVKESLGTESAMRTSVDEIIRAADRSRDLVSQLLSLGRRRAPDLRPLDLNRIVKESSSMLRLALRQNIAIEYRLPSSPYLVAADQGRIEEILLNLALNAQDAIPREGRIEIATTEVIQERVYARRQADPPPGRFIQLIFSDNGQGMARETLTKIFTPFFTTKEQGKGTGLGLYTVYGIVKEHHGTIEVESHPGAGARFVISFPRIEAPVLEPPAFKKAEAAKGRETVLLVDDEEPIRAMLSEGLRDLGYTVLEASDGASALRVFTESGWGVHLLVTDVVMPCMSGTDLYEQLRSQKPELKVLFISGHPKEVIRTHLVKDAGIELLAKPFSGQALASRVREILDR